MTEQQKFEAALSCEEDWGHRSFKKRKDGRYEKWSVQLAWDAWQARASQDRSAEWQPIETAPRDGRRVLVWIDDKHLNSQRRNVHFASLWFYDDGRLGGGAEGFNGNWNITHWMPLPPPPAGTP